MVGLYLKEMVSGGPQLHSGAEGSPVLAHNALLRGQDQMKHATIPRICCLPIICFVGFLPIAYLHAQQPVTVTPEVKADALRRLDLSKSAQIPQRMVDKDGLWLRICNKGPKASDPGTQEEACSRFLIGMTGDFARVRSLDDLLPAFKSCALSSDCGMSIEAIAESGHPDYALALAEYAPNCKGCVVLGEVNPNSATGTIQGLLYLGQHGAEDNDPNLAAMMKAECYVETPLDPSNGPARTVCKSAKEYIELGSADDVRKLLERGCTEAGRQSACRLYQMEGGNYDESARSQAALARQNEDAASTQTRKDQDSSYYRAEASSQERTAGILGALNSSNTAIQQTATQQQANLQAMAAANQQRQQAQTQQQPSSSTSVPATRSSSVNIAGTTPATTASPGAASSSSGNNPYSSAPAQGSYNPYTATGSGSAQGSCTDMTGSVQGTVKVGSDGWVSGYLTNNSNQALFVSYTFKQNGVPSTAMANSGGTTIQGGQTVGGEGQGLYSTGADKNPPEIYWYAVLKSEHDKYGCAHNW